MRRTLLLAALLAGSATMLAAERATFIMTNGERVTGTLVARTNTSANIAGGAVLLNTSNRNVRVPLNDVAVIDFAGGQPSARELDAVTRNTNRYGQGQYDQYGQYSPYGQYGQDQRYGQNRQYNTAASQMMVLRNGQMMSGSLRNILRGDTVRWVFEPGDVQDVPIRDIARIYLNPDAAQSAYSYSGYNDYGYGPQSRYSPYGAPGYQTYGSQMLTPPDGIPVDAASEWTDTGITVRAGDMLSFVTSGQVKFGLGDEQVASPDGNTGVRRNTYPVPAMSVGGLIGKVGRSAAFPIGANQNPIRMPANGRLLLGVNDDQRGDNSGAFYVVINRR